MYALLGKKFQQGIIEQMDLNDLNNHQFILLVIMVSFITSMATGIVTVTLMDEAPPNVIKTVNRIVERTVETVVKEPETQTATAKQIVEQVVVDERVALEDVISSVEEGVLVFASSSPPRIAVALPEVIVGPFATDEFEIDALNSKKETIHLAHTRNLRTVGLYESSVGDIDAQEHVDLSSLRLGQRVYALSYATENPQLLSGIVQELEKEGDGFLTSLTPTNTSSLLFTEEGKVLAISAYVEEKNSYVYTPFEHILARIEAE